MQAASVSLQDVSLKYYPLSRGLTDILMAVHVNAGFLVLLRKLQRSKIHRLAYTFFNPRASL